MAHVDCEFCRLRGSRPDYKPQDLSKFEAIKVSNIDDLKKKNWELTSKLEAAEQAPVLLKNMYQELETAEERVGKLQKALDMATSKGDDSKEKYEQVQKTTKRISDLKRRLDEAYRKNRVLQRKLQDRQKLERKLEKAAVDMEKVKSDVDIAAKRSQQLTEELDEARKKERELKRADMKLREMQNDLANANEKLQKLEETLKLANEKWMKKPRAHVTVDVRKGSSHSEATQYDVSGRHIDSTVNIKSLDYVPPAKSKAKFGKQAETIRPGDSLRFAVADLERRTNLFETKNKNILSENERLAKEVRIMKQAMERMGYNLKREPISTGGSGRSL